MKQINVAVCCVRQEIEFYSKKLRLQQGCFCVFSRDVDVGEASVPLLNGESRGVHQQGKMHHVFIAVYTYI